MQLRHIWRVAALAGAGVMGLQAPWPPVARVAPATYRLSLAIARYEGFGKPGTLCTRLHNPGALRYAHQPGAVRGARGFASFTTDTEGFSALRARLHKSLRKGLDLSTLMKVYAPPSENDTSRYVRYLQSVLGKKGQNQ